MKGFLYSITHALPTAVVMLEDGKIACSHAGSDSDDARSWLLHHHQNTTLKDVEIVSIDQELFERHYYNAEPVTILPEDFQKAIINAQEKRG